MSRSLLAGLACTLFILPALLAEADTLYEYNFDGGSLANTGTATDGALTATGVAPVYVTSYTDANNVTRNDLYDYSTGSGTRSHHFSNIANQNLTTWTVGFWALDFNAASPPSEFSSAFMNDTFQLNNTAGTWRYRGSNTTFGTVLTNTWQFIALTNDGTNTRLYVDGALGDTLGDVGGGFNEIGIGTNRARDNPGRWNGLIDDVFVLNTTLSQQNITDLYMAGIPEPSSLALLGHGGLLIARRRRI